MDCCSNEKNLIQDKGVKTCQVCGRRHYEMDAEAGVFGLDGARIG